MGRSGASSTCGGLAWTWPWSGALRSSSGFLVALCGPGAVVRRRVDAGAEWPATQPDSATSRTPASVSTRAPASLGASQAPCSGLGPCAVPELPSEVAPAPHVVPKRALVPRPRAAVPAPRCPAGPVPQAPGWVRPAHPNPGFRATEISAGVLLLVQTASHLEDSLREGGGQCPGSGLCLPGAGSPSTGAVASGGLSYPALPPGCRGGILPCVCPLRSWCPGGLAVVEAAVLGPVV